MPFNSVWHSTYRTLKFSSLRFLANRSESDTHPVQGQEWTWARVCQQEINIICIRIPCAVSFVFVSEYTELILAGCLHRYVLKSTALGSRGMAVLLQIRFASLFKTFKDFQWKFDRPSQAYTWQELLGCELRGMVSRLPVSQTSFKIQRGVKFDTSYKLNYNEAGIWKERLRCFKIVFASILETSMALTYDKESDQWHVSVPK